jgi:glutamine---fructose-6-phosphate transaminase (isomerizing)
LRASAAENRKLSFPSPQISHFRLACFVQLSRLKTSMFTMKGSLAMCGIVGAVNGTSVVPELLGGLRRLEYRGYDSAGIAVLDGRHLERRRAKGKLTNLENLLAQDPIDGRIGIAHTRWATHGVPSVANAHPHATSDVAVVHNGIIENFRELRQEMEGRGQIFESSTDTEVIPRLITSYLEDGLSPEEATRQALERLRGAYALGILFDGEDNRVFAARKGSPLVLGIADNANYLASDAMALAAVAPEVIYLEDGDWAQIGQDRVEIRDNRGRHVRRPARRMTHDSATVGKNGYRHYMQKEIHEQPDAVRRTLATVYDISEAKVVLPDLPFDLATLSRLTIVACGTSYHAGLVARYWFERYAGLPVDVDTASEFRYREPPLEAGGAALFISQSGETADTLAALRHVKACGQHAVAVVNVPESTMAREADVVLETRAGTEIGVASTKAFTTQLTVLAGLAIAAGRARGVLSATEEDTLTAALLRLPNQIEDALERESSYAEIARVFARARSTLFMGRGTAFPIALEGALKLKEISYIHAEGYGAGELKHGPIALIDETVPVVVVAPRDGLFEKTVSNLQEVKARGGRIVLLSDDEGIAEAGDEAAGTVALPQSDPLVAPILYTVPLQLLAYHVAVAKGTDVDQPRNLAKSVTVE